MKQGPLTIRKQFEITAGDMLVQCEADEQDRLCGPVEIYIGGPGAPNERRVKLDEVAEVERAAEVLRSVRRELGDARGICAVHGYYGFDVRREYSCPECARALAPVLVKGAP